MHSSSSDPFVPHAAPGHKLIPRSYAVANWVLTKSREDGVPLPAGSLFRFNLGRSAPWPVTVNARSQCSLHGYPPLAVPGNQYYKPGHGPDPYVPARYAPCGAFQ